MSSSVFPLGGIYLTAGVHQLSEQHQAFQSFVASCISQHSQGHWGSLCESDQAINQAALEHGGRLFSSYSVPASVGVSEPRVWVITESDRSATTVLFPGEY